MSQDYIIGNLAGDVTGELTGKDYGADLQAIASQLEGCKNAIVALDSSLKAGNTALHGNVSAAAAGTGLLQNLFGIGASPGSVPAILSAGVDQTTVQTSHLGNVASGIAVTAQSVTERSGDLSQIASQFAIFNASAQIFIAQAARNIAFQQASTNSALARSGLPEVEVPETSVEEGITTAVNDAVTVGTQAQISGFVNEQISTATGFATEVASNYIQSTALGGFIAQKLSAARTALLGSDPKLASGESEETAVDGTSAAKNP